MGSKNSMSIINQDFKFYFLVTILLFLLAAFDKASADDINALKDNNNSQAPSLPTKQTSINQDVGSNKEQQQQCNIKLNKITGNVYSLQHDDITTMRMSLMNTKILINYGQYIAYPKEDGSFEVDNLPSDSYVVEAIHPKYIYEPFRVDITSKGKIRARRVNYIQPSLVQTVDYPLRFRPKSLHNYFLPRETWRIMDLIFNPMVIMMVVPLVIIWLLPKMMNPQEVQTQRESMQMPEYNVPELSEMMANMFGRQGQAGGNQGNSNGGGNQAITSGGSSGAGTGASSRHSKAKRR